jgi:hypothetical protein
VVVRVVEARHHGAPLEAHHLRRVQVAAQLVPVADRDDAAAQHGQCGRARPRGIHGQERAALEDPVDAHRRLVRRVEDDRPRR